MIRPQLISGNDYRTEDIFPYLIIAPSKTLYDIPNLATWKTRKGLKTKIVTFSEIISNYEGYDFEEQVRNCEIDYYTNHGTIFVCMVSGEGTSYPSGIYPPMRLVYPYYPGTPTPSDNYYTNLDGNWDANGNHYYGQFYSGNPDEVDFYADIYLGRLQAGATGDTAKIIDKTLCYEGAQEASETNPWDYQGNALMAGAWLDAGDTNQEIEMEYIIDNYLDSNQFWQITGLWDSVYTGDYFSPSRFIDELNNAPGVVAHADHAGHDYLSTNPYQTPGYAIAIFNTDLYSLTNAPRYAGVFYSSGCDSADPYYTNNCAISYVTAPDGGGVGYIGNTVSVVHHTGYPLDYNQAYQIAFFHQLTDYNNTVTSNALENVKDSYIRGGVPWCDDSWLALYLSGEPEVDIFNDYITEFVVNYDDSVPTGTQDYEVHVESSPGSTDVEGALVCLWKGHEVYVTGLTDSNGDIVFDNIDPSTEGRMYLTVIKHNFKPFEAVVEVTDNRQINLIFFHVKPIQNGNELSWLIKSKQRIDGFNVYRQEIKDNMLKEAKLNKNIPEKSIVKLGKIKSSKIQPQKTIGNWEKINTQLISGKNPYFFFDKTSLGLKYEYYLEAVLNGKGYKLENQNQAIDESTDNLTKGKGFALHISPNPATNNLSLEIQTDTSCSAMLEIKDLSGRLVCKCSSLELPCGDSRTNIDTTKFVNEVYILKLSGSFGLISRNIVVAH